MAGSRAGTQRRPLAARCCGSPVLRPGVSQLRFCLEKCPEALTTPCPYLVPPGPATETGTPSSSTDPNPSHSAHAQGLSRPPAEPGLTAWETHMRSTPPPSLVHLYIEPLLCASHRPAPPLQTLKCQSKFGVNPSQRGDGGGHPWPLGQGRQGGRWEGGEPGDGLGVGSGRRGCSVANGSAASQPRG